MIRIFFSYVLPLFLPTILYFVWKKYVRKESFAEGDVEIPWVYLVLFGILLAFIFLGSFAAWEQNPADSVYVPAKFRDGKLVDAEMKRP